MMYGFLGAVFVALIVAFSVNQQAETLGLWVGFAFLSITGALIGIFIFHSRDTAIHITDTHLVLKAPIYGRTIPLTAIQRVGIKSLDLKDPGNFEYGLKWRTNGLGLPRLNIGWFKLRSGEKAWCYVTDPSSVVYLPTTEGYAVMVSCSDRDAFMSSLRRS